MSLPGALNILSAYPEDGEDMDLVSNFSHLDINARPSFGDLLPMVVAWIGEETEERLAFYTADEGPQSSASPKAKAKAPHTLPDGSTAPGKAKSAAKKPTVATFVPTDGNSAGSPSYDHRPVVCPHYEAGYAGEAAEVSSIRPAWFPAHSSWEVSAADFKPAQRDSQESFHFGGEIGRAHV